MNYASEDLARYIRLDCNRTAVDRRLHCKRISMSRIFHVFNWMLCKYENDCNLSVFRWLMNSFIGNLNSCFNRSNVQSHLIDLVFIFVFDDVFNGVSQIVFRHSGVILFVLLQRRRLRWTFLHELFYLLAFGIFLHFGACFEEISMNAAQNESILRCGALSFTSIGRCWLQFNVWGWNVVSECPLCDSMTWYLPCFSHESTIPSRTFSIFPLLLKTAVKTSLAFSLSKWPSFAISVSSKMHSVVQHQVLNVVSCGWEQLAMHLSLISAAKSSGTEQHSMGSFDTWGQNRQALSSIDTKSSDKGDGML